LVETVPETDPTPSSTEPHQFLVKNSLEDLVAKTDRASKKVTNFETALNTSTLNVTKLDSALSNAKQGMYILMDKTVPELKTKISKTADELDILDTRFQVFQDDIARDYVSIKEFQDLQHFVASQLASIYQSKLTLKAQFKNDIDTLSLLLGFKLQSIENKLDASENKLVDRMGACEGELNVLQMMLHVCEARQKVAEANQKVAEANQKAAKAKADTAEAMMMDLANRWSL
jgi:hypothetical protein